MRRASSILRKHRAAERVYIPKDARDNQYILAEFHLTDELIKSVADDFDPSIEKPYHRFYLSMALTIFRIVESHGVKHANFLANNKKVRVRYGGEHQVLHTEEQSFFFYCPSHNATFKWYFDGAVKARKIKVLFLATGEELRLNSSKFHENVYNATKEIAETYALPEGAIKLRDHQHLTYDIFAKEKGLKETMTHSFREVSARYLQQGYDIGKDHTSMTYAIANVPMARRLLKNTDINYDSETPYTALYEKIESAFRKAAADNGIDQAVIVGNGVSSFVRYDKDEKAELKGDLMMLGYNPENEEPNIRSYWGEDRLADSIKFVFFADKSEEINNNYGRFVNQVNQTVLTFANSVFWKKDHDDIMMRIHQHVTRII